MHLRATWHRQRQWLLAVLCLLASLAYLGRAAPSSARLIALTALQPAANAPEAQPHSHRAEHHPDGPPAPGPSHGAHCPFCFTAAFALEPPEPGVPFLEQGRPEGRPRQAVQVTLAGVRHVDPRAPPSS